MVELSLEQASSYAAKMYEEGHYNKSLSVCDTICSAVPNHPNILNIKAACLIKLGKFKQAQIEYKKLIKLGTTDNNVLYNYALSLYRDKKFKAARKWLNQVLSRDPVHAVSLLLVAEILLIAQNQPQEAIKKLQLIDHASRNEAFFNLLAKAHVANNQFKQAQDSYLNSYRLNPQNGEAVLGVLEMYRQQFLYQDIIQFCDGLHEAFNDHPFVCYYRAKALFFLRELQSAYESIKHAYAMLPESERIIETYYHIAAHLCAWDDLDLLKKGMQAIDQKTLENRTSLSRSPIDASMLITDKQLQLACAKIWASEQQKRFKFTGKVKARLINKNSNQDTLNIGYISPDFREHPLVYLTRSMFAHHQNNVFIYSYSGSKLTDNVREIKNSVSTYRDISQLTDAEAVDVIQQDNIHILVDLSVANAYARPAIMMARPASIQISYLGLIGTSGASFYDYIIGDEIVTPISESKYYTEKLMLLPECYQVNDNDSVISDQPLSRADFGLSDDDIVFCSYNQAIKFDPIMFSVWLNIMKRVPESKFMIYCANDATEENLKSFANKHAVDSSRFIFVQSIPNDLYLKRIGLADLSLDTRIYNGGTITSNCLYMGVPVVTLKGEHFASRMAASILTNHGVPELVTHSLEEYEELVVCLCNDPKKLKALKQKVKANVATEPLFNTKRFVKHLESAYKLAWKRFADGNEPEHIKVPLIES